MASNFASRELCPRHRPLKPRSRPPSAGTHMTHSLSLSLSQKQQFTDIPTSLSHLIFDQSLRIIINKRNKHCLIKFFLEKFSLSRYSKKKKNYQESQGTRDFSLSRSMAIRAQREIFHFLRSLKRRWCPFNGILLLLRELRVELKEQGGQVFV